MIAEPVTLRIPFRGPRNYLYGADTVDDALAATGLAEEAPDVSFAYYKQIGVNTLRRHISEMPLSPKTFAATVQLKTRQGTTRYIGYQAVTPDPDETLRVPCSEADHRPGMHVSGRHGRLCIGAGIATSPMAAAVITTKLTSLQVFPFDDVKWLFARAALQTLPACWTEIDVETDSSEYSRFFRWSVSFDGQRSGEIIFYRGKVSDV